MYNIIFIEKFNFKQEEIIYWILIKVVFNFIIITSEKN